VSVGVESPDHLFLDCPFASKVWSKVLNWCGWSGEVGQTIRDRIDCYNNLGGSEMKRSKAYVIIMATVRYI